MKALFGVASAMLFCIACQEQETRSVAELELELARVETARLLVERGHPCERVIGQDGNLLVCQIASTDIRIYRILGPERIERVRPGLP